MGENLLIGDRVCPDCSWHRIMLQIWWIRWWRNWREFFRWKARSRTWEEVFWVCLHVRCCCKSLRSTMSPYRLNCRIPTGIGRIRDCLHSFRQEFHSGPSLMLVQWELKAFQAPGLPTFSDVKRVIFQNEPSAAFGRVLGAWHVQIMKQNSLLIVALCVAWVVGSNYRDFEVWRLQSLIRVAVARAQGFPKDILRMIFGFLIFLWIFSGFLRLSLMDCLWNVCGLLGNRFQRGLDWISAVDGINCYFSFLQVCSLPWWVAGLSFGVVYTNVLDWMTFKFSMRWWHGSCRQTTTSFHRRW